MATQIEKWSPLKSWFYTLLHRTPKSNGAAVDLAAVGEGTRFLDIGCGPGAALDRARSKGARVSGVDPSPSMVERAAKRVAAADVRVGSAEALPFPDSEFDVVINVSSFHHWADRDSGLREAHRVLANHGRLLIVEGKIDEGKDGHGLTPSEAASVAARLLEVGFSESEVSELEVSRRHTYLVVTGHRNGGS